MIRPNDVPAELVEKAARHRFERHLGHYPEITWESVAETIRAKYLASAADYLAAVLPDVRKAAWSEGFNAAVDAGEPANVWLAEWDDITNPYGTARLTATTTEEPTT